MPWIYSSKSIDVIHQYFNTVVLTTRLGNRVQPFKSRFASPLDQHGAKKYIKFIQIYLICKMNFLKIVFCNLIQLK